MRKNKAAVALGKRGGLARSKRLTKAQRSQSAALAASHRWASQREHLIRVVHEWQTAYVDSFKVEGSSALEVSGPVSYREGDELLNLEELAQRLKISKTTAYGLTRKRAKVRSIQPLPYFKIGKELRFNWSAVVEWLNALEKGASNVSEHLVR